MTYSVGDLVEVHDRDRREWVPGVVEDMRLVMGGQDLYVKTEILHSGLRTIYAVAARDVDDLVRPAG